MSDAAGHVVGAEVGDARQVCVVIDTNVWKAQVGLRSSMGAALLHAIRQSSGVLGLPEVVESEVRKQLGATGVDAIDSAEKALRHIQSLTRFKPTVLLPSDDEIRVSVNQLFVELEPVLLRVPLTVAHARAALSRVNARNSPNQGKEQFKDSLIWAATKELSAAYRTLFVTSDRAFFQGSGFDLAEDLAKEVHEEGLDLAVFGRLPDVLAALRDQVPNLDDGAILHDIYGDVTVHVQDQAPRWGFSVGGRTSGEVRAFATEDMDVVALSFTVSGSLIDQATPVIGNEREGAFQATGETTYNRTTRQLLATRIERLTLYVPDEQGQPSAQVFVYTSVSFGSPPEPYSVRHALD